MRDFHQANRSDVIAANGMCATSHPLAAKAAISILESGGNAADAAIAGAVLLGICEPQMTGLGGDCFALVKPAGQEAIFGLNGSGRAPAALRAEDLRKSGHDTVPLEDPAAVTIPGAVAAFAKLSADFGQMGLDAALAPAIHYAEEGVPVAPRVACDWTEEAEKLTGDAGRFFLTNGKAPKVGTRFAAPGQADVLRRIAEHGPEAFYTGEVAEDMVAALRARGGVHTLDDFAACIPDAVDPVLTTYRGHDLVELPPNGQGVTALLLSNILSHFDIASMDPFGPERAHIEAEACKLAYDARDRFVSENTPRLDHILSNDTAAKLAGLIDPKRAMPDPRKATDAVHKDTIYITVVDKDRMAVSLIYSIFHSFGSGIASSKFGLLLQNRGGGFTLEAGHPNEAAGGKRPMHTIIPGMIRTDGRLLMPFGVMGGQYQPCGHVRFLSNIVDFGMTPQEAIEGPRCFAQAGQLKVERGHSDATRAALAALGHDVIIPDSPLGGAQAIRIEGDVLIGGSDPRKDGCALGY